MDLPWVIRPHAYQSMGNTAFVSGFWDSPRLYCQKSLCEQKSSDDAVQWKMLSSKKDCSTRRTGKTPGRKWLHDQITGSCHGLANTRFCSCYLFFRITPDSFLQLYFSPAGTYCCGRYFSSACLVLTYFLSDHTSKLHFHAVNQVLFSLIFIAGFRKLRSHLAWILYRRSSLSLISKIPLNFQ